MSVPIRSVKVWVNAFIPQDIPGYTRVVPRGTYAGKTMIPGPQRPGFGTSRIEISDCYLTDQRGFSNEIHAKSRLHSEIRVDYNGPRPVLSDWHNCDPTTECDCEDGAVEATKKGDASRCRCTLLIPFGQAAAAAGKVSVK